MNIYYIIYQTTNIINNKIYIGKHITSNIDDGYLGSGKRLINAIKKYGCKNFKREILFFLNSEEELNLKEQELVNLEFIQRNDTYNITLGGNGGVTVLLEGHPLYEQTKQKISNSRKGSRHWTNGVLTKLSKDCPGEGWYIGRASNSNFKHSDLVKSNMKSAMSGGNMCWWNNGHINKRQKDKPIGDDWAKGRLKSSISNKFLSGKDYIRKYDYVFLQNIDTFEIFKLSNITSELKSFCRDYNLSNIFSRGKCRNFKVIDVILNPNYNGRFK